MLTASILSIEEKLGGRAIRWAGAVVALLAALCLSTPAALGQVTSTWSTSSGNWTTPDEWTCVLGPGNCMPNNTVSNTFAAVLDSPDNTLTLDNTSSPTSISISLLTLSAGTLNIGSGGTLNLTDQPKGITDIPIAAGLSLEGTFEIGGNPAASGLGSLNSVEGTLTLANQQTTNVTPGGGMLTNSGTMNVQQSSTLAITGALTNSGAINTGNGVNDAGYNVVTVSGRLINNGTISLNGESDSLSAASVTNVGAINFTPSAAFDTISTGTFDNQGGSVTLNGGDDTLNTGTFNNKGGLVLVWGSFENLNASTFNNNDGTVALLNVGFMSVAGVFSNKGGLVVVNGNSSLGVGTFNNSGGSVSVLAEGGGLGVAGNFYNNGGSLDLSGDVNGVFVGGDFNNHSGLVVVESDSNFMSVGGAFNNSDGTVTLDGEGGPGVGLGVGSFNNSGGTVTDAGTFDSLGAGTFSNDGGTVTLDGMGAGVWGGPTIGTGTFSNNRGLVTLDGSGETLSATTFSNNRGRVTLNGTGDILSATTFNNGAGTVTLASQCGVGCGETLTATTFSNNGGRVTLDGSGDTLSAGAFSNAGSVTVGSNETLTIQNNYTQSGSGASLNVDGSLTAATATINRGTVSGGGTITANVNNVGGRVTASDPGIPEILTIMGNYSQGSGGTLEAFLGGTAPGGYSQLVVDGTATLDGKLDVDFVSGFDPTLDENFFLLTSTGTGLVSGTFSNLELPKGDAWLVSYNTACPTGTTGCVDLTYEGAAKAPEPSTFLLLAMVMAVMAVLLRYRSTVGSDLFC